MSHVAYPDQVMTGNSPKGFDQRLISILAKEMVNSSEAPDVNRRHFESPGHEPWEKKRKEILRRQ
ncbi:MAG: hypothetical protein M1826_002525 [Phylliscum demangeonii]|nr:MAG: hypothetical protein M1826_002525 [Phylliscum demangeonii]